VTALLGAHVPTAGGLANAPERGKSIGAEAIQIFTRSQLQWKARPLAADEVHAFRDAFAQSGLRRVVAHGSYLVNLASPDRSAVTRSREAFVAEIERCHALGIEHLIFHPGAHMGAGEERGLAALAESLDHVLERTRGASVTPLLEVTAGQGSSLGHRFEHLAEILRRVKRSERLGVCLDTCHLFAAGYDIASERGYDETWRAFEGIVGSRTLKAIHLNDAKMGLGSRLDRHAPVGKGHLGRETFRRIVADPRLAGIPLILETPGGMEGWKREIRLLRRFRKAL
jgi:deoxyribonuclease-4